jgi:signal transduction histidine kinase
MNRPLAAAAGGIALLISTIAMVVAVAEVPGAGVWPDGPGGLVRAVDPGGPAWVDGIRSGQRVEALNSEADQTRWSLETFDGAVHRRSAVAGYLEALRGLIPIAGIAWTVACLGLLGILVRRRAGVALTSTAFLLAALPLAYSDNRAIALASGTLSLAGPALALGSVGHRRLALILVVGAIAVAVAWLASAISIADAFDSLDGARQVAALSICAACGISVLDVQRIRRWVSARESPSVVDVAALAAWFAVVVTAWLVLRLDPIPLFAVAGGLMAIYPTWRRLAIRALDDWVMANVRSQATIAAAEQERARLAREIHDTPLAELSGIIRQLDLRPDARAESDSLRAVAEHLRDVAVRLHPPVLEDLGLAAAIHDLADNGDSAGPNVEVNVDDLTSQGDGRRPPEEAEVAAYRVVQEAISNAKQHAAASHIRVVGSVSKDAIELDVVDDGNGIEGASVQAARRNGHFGLDSMRQRAQSIGGQVTIEGATSGTTIRFRWTG